MKKINTLFALMLAVLSFTACQEPDEYAVYQEPGQFQLFMPGISSAVLDLEHSSDLTLTCEKQPDYGFTAAVEYQAEVSITGNFGAGESVMLSTISQDPRFTVDAGELAAELTTLVNRPESEFPKIMPLYFRVRASLAGSAKAHMEGIEKGVTYSNVIKLEKVRLHYALAPVVPPTKMAIIGGFCGWSWDKAYDMVPEWYDGTPCGTFWRLMYFDAETNFKFNIEKAWDGGEVGYAGVDGRITDNAGANVTSSGDGNIIVNKAGWYLVIIRTAVVGRDYQFSITFDAPNVYLFGACNGGTWEALDDWKFSVPDGADGEFVSPAFAADGEVRATVIVDPANWWHSEFLVFGNQLVYRGIGGDQERVSATAGQRISINFTNGTGSIK